MTYLDSDDTRYSEIQRYGSPAAPVKTFPAEIRFFDTAPLRLGMAMFVALLGTFFVGGGVKHGAAKHIKDMMKFLIELCRIEQINFAVSLKAAMKADPNWQAQVREDLGGDDAVNKWHMRQQTTHASAASASLKKPTAKTSATATTSAKPQTKPGSVLKTDRHGLFCLAPIPRAAARPGGPAKTQTYTGFRGSRLNAAFLPPKPIPVTPDDLRPAARTGRALPARTEIIRQWQRLSAEHFTWFGQLTLADLALTLPAFRDDFQPP